MAVHYGCRVRQSDLNRKLIDATLLDDIDAMRRALQNGADVDARDAEHRETPLMLARSEGAVKLLLDHHADVHARNNRGETVLMYRPWRAVREHGGDINTQSDSGETPLMKTVITGDLGRVEQVLAMGADVGLRDCDGRTALDVAVEWGLVVIAERLRAAMAVP